MNHKQLDLGMQTLPGNYSSLLLKKRSRLRVKGGRVRELVFMQEPDWMLICECVYVHPWQKEKL